MTTEWKVQHCIPPHHQVGLSLFCSQSPAVLSMNVTDPHPHNCLRNIVCPCGEFMWVCGKNHSGFLGHKKSFHTFCFPLMQQQRFQCGGRECKGKPLPFCYVWEPSSAHRPNSRPRLFLPWCNSKIADFGTCSHGILFSGWWTQTRKSSWFGILNTASSLVVAPPPPNTNTPHFSWQLPRRGSRISVRCV